MRVVLAWVSAQGKGVQQVAGARQAVRDPVGIVLGEEALAGITNARKQVASLFNCQPKRIFFASGGTEVPGRFVCNGDTFFDPNSGEHILFYAEQAAALIASFIRALETDTSFVPI